MATRGSSAALKKKIQRLAAGTDDGRLELAEALCEARALPRTPKGERPTLADLVEITKLSRRTLNYLISVWKRFGDLDIPRDRLARVGWTKLAIIAEHCDPGDELQALDIAQTCTAKELPALLKGTRRTSKKRTVLLRLTPGQYEDFEQVLLAHGANRPTRGKKNWGLAGKEAALTMGLRQLRAAETL